MTQPIVLTLVACAPPSGNYRGAWMRSDGAGTPWLVARPFDATSELSGRDKLPEGALSIIEVMGDPWAYAVKETVEEIANLVDARRLHTE